ncbi:MAG: ATP-binding protein, partial [Sphingomonadaceae bacterium]
ARRASLGAMTNLMCRGRKRGLAGVIATQRLAKLAKNVAAEASNFLMGRTFLDIDMARAADLLGMERRQAESIRDLARGQFLALGPAVSRRPVAIDIGAVKTSARSSSPKLVPLPTASTENVGDLILARDAAPPPPPPPPARVAVPSEELIRTIARPQLAPAADAPIQPAMAEDTRTGIIAAVLAEVAADPEAAFRPVAVLFQDFQLRCRMQRLPDSGIDLAAFRRRMAMARAGLFDENEEGWEGALALAAELPEDMLGAFLLIARAAREGREAPDENALAEVYGTRSPGRVRRLIAYMETRDLIVVRTDLGGKRSINIPRLGWTTAATAAESEAPARSPRPAENATLF